MQFSHKTSSMSIYPTRSDVVIQNVSSEIHVACSVNGHLGSNIEPSCKVSFEPKTKKWKLRSRSQFLEVGPMLFFY